MIDSHAHYSYRSFEQTFPFLSYDKGEYSVLYGDRNSIFEDMKRAGVSCYIEPGIDLDSNYKALKLRAESPISSYVAVGVHPTRGIFVEKERGKELYDLVKAEGVVAIGETGLDYHYKGFEQHKPLQKYWFEYQLDLAVETGLPLVLHVREASEDALRILETYDGKLHGGVAHCFNEGKEMAGRYVELGYLLGIGGALLQNTERAASLREAVIATPVDAILLETDAPYVLPVCEDKYGNPFSDNIRNSSSVVLAVAEEVAKLKDTDVSEIIKKTTENAEKLFGIKVK